MIVSIGRRRQALSPDEAGRELLACIEELRVAQLEIALQRRCIGSLASQLASVGRDAGEPPLDARDNELATWCFDGGGNTIEASRALCDMLEVAEPAILATRPLTALATEASCQHLWERLAPLDDKTAVNLEIEIIGQVSGRHRQVAISVIPTMGTGTERVYAAILVNLTARRNDETCTRFLSRQDSLTGLPNRAAFDEKAHQALAIARRNGSIVAMLCIDLDRFKTVNESHGPATGDRLLCEVAGRLQAITRESDVVARFGSDEFAVLATNLRDPDEIGTLASKIAARLGEPYDIGGRALSCTADIGTALYPADGSDLDTLFDTANAALHRAKGEAARTPADDNVVRGLGLFLRLAQSPELPQR